MRVSAINRPRVRDTEAAQAPALAREVFDAGRLQHFRLTLTQVQRIRGAAAERRRTMGAAPGQAVNANVMLHCVC